MPTPSPFCESNAEHHRERLAWEQECVIGGFFSDFIGASWQDRYSMDAPTVLSYPEGSSMYPDTQLKALEAAKLLALFVNVLRVSIGLRLLAHLLARTHDLVHQQEL